MEGAGGIAGTRVQVVTIFEADGTDDRFQPHATADGEQSGIKGVVAGRARETERVGKKDQAPSGGESLLEFNGAETVRFGANKIPFRISGRSLAFLVAANRVFTAGKEAFVEREVFDCAAQAQHDAMAETDAQEAASAQRMMPGAP